MHHASSRVYIFASSYEDNGSAFINIDFKECCFMWSRNSSSSYPKLPQYSAEKKVSKGQLTSLDLFSGNGVIPTVIRGEFPQFSCIHASDISDQAVDMTLRNLELFNDNSAARINVFQHNIVDHFSADEIPNNSVDVTVIDPPYGHHCHWLDRGRNKVSDPFEVRELFALTFRDILPTLRYQSVVGVILSPDNDFTTDIPDFNFVKEHELKGHHASANRKIHIFQPKKTY